MLITVAYARGILTGALLADDDAVRKPPRLCGLPKSAATMSPSNIPTLLKAWS